MKSGAEKRYMLGSYLRFMPRVFNFFYVSSLRQFWFDAWIFGWWIDVPRNYTVKKCKIKDGYEEEEDNL